MKDTANEIRNAFLEFFRSKGHKVIPSAPMVVQNDPTLMFTNAGMNQFKDIFLGNQPIEHPRVANTQKCLRVSGKHNDLEEVGHDTFHHTMFEMLGNWSFGDYFKQEAITWSWEFLTGILGVPEERIYATVFEGDRQDGLDMDQESMNFWLDHLPEDHVLKGSKKDNFWEMGDTGPCGPCSEIHIDMRPGEERKLREGMKLVNTGHPGVIEIWNLVFIQYNRKMDGKLQNLPLKHVDTGLGLERLAMVMQGKRSSYDTDLFRSLIAELERISGRKYGREEPVDIAMRVVTDHLRAVSFSIADSQLPSNIKAGYVIRRILRRAVRYGYTFLNLDKPFLYRLVGVLSSGMGEAFPEIPAQRELIEKVIREEETSFLKTLANGIRMLEQKIQEVRKKKDTVLDGKSAFALYDTYGFPFDLTRLILKEDGLDVSHAEFEREMQAQKSRSREASSTPAGEWHEVFPVDATKFLGYDTDQAKIRISRYRKSGSKGKTIYHLVFDQTPFYAESGGQVGDSGVIENAGEKIPILDTRKENNLILHHAPRLPDNLEAAFTARVNLDHRKASAHHHTATHLLHHALRTVLGPHVEQKGSLVHPEYLRFDFSHFEKPGEKELEQIEAHVNRLIRENIPVNEERQLSIKEATEKGALAFFGEKYGDHVRVIQFGDSIELCGGIHVNSTGEIGFVKIVRESAIAAGIRRIEAVAGKAAEQYIREQAVMVRAMQNLLKTHNPPDALDKVLKENTRLKRQLEAYASDQRKVARQELTQKARKIGKVNLITGEIQLRSADNIKNLAFELKAEIKNLVLVLGANLDGKAHLSIMVSENLVDELHIDARKLVREVSREIQGGGGGQSFYATAGGKNPGGIPGALEKVSQLVRQAAGK